MNTVLETVRKFEEKHLPQTRFGGFQSLPKLIDLEIGCGSGEFAHTYAQSNPSRSIVAIEHTRNRFLQFKNRCQSYGWPKNLFPVHANAISWVSQHLKTQQLSRVFLWYPNPYPKTRQANKRWHRMSFMWKLLDQLVQEGEVYLATNQLFYAEEARDYFLHFWNLHLEYFVSWERFSKPHFLARTAFEKKYFDRGEQLYELKCVKPALQDSNLRPSD